MYNSILNKYQFFIFAVKDTMLPENKITPSIRNNILPLVNEYLKTLKTLVT